MRRALRPRLGVRWRLTLSIAAILLAAYGITFFAVSRQMSNESAAIGTEEHREAATRGESGGEPRTAQLSTIREAQSDVSRTLLVVGSITLAAGLLAGYLLAAWASRQRAFVADASHEMRTSLTVIQGQLEVLARRPDPSREEVGRVSAIVSAAVARMQRLVDDVVLLARAEGGSAARLEDVDVPALLASQLDEFGATAARDFQLGPAPAGTVHADGDRLAQVVANLLANAVAHTAEGGAVRLSAERSEGSVVVAVDDDGPGIAPEEREQVFERLHRGSTGRKVAHMATNRPVGSSGGGSGAGASGSGLGLAIARAIVEAHGGRIWAEDSPLGGARVAFELPGFAPRQESSTMRRR
jgi:two-component system OmpR family sensor kinase